MKIVVIIAFLSIFIAVGSISPVLASSQMEVTIDPNSDTAIAKMTYQRSVNIDYSDGELRKIHLDFYDRWKFLEKRHGLG